MDPAASKALFDEAVETMRGRRMFQDGGVVIESATFPDLVLDLPHPTGGRRRFRVRADDWDEQPPSVQPIDANGNAVHGEPSGGFWTGLNSGWGLCKVGTREYHRHHTENPWEAHRAKTGLDTIVTRLMASYRASAG